MLNVPINAQTVGAGTSVVSNGVSFAYAVTGFSLYYHITGDGTVALFYHVALDGINFVKETKAIKRGLTKTSGPNADGKGVLYFPVIPGNAIKIEVEETGGASGVVATIKLASRIGQFGDTPVYDGASKAITVIEYPHHEIHDGNGYFAVYSALANTAGTIAVRVQTPNTTKWAHMIFEIDSALAATAQLWHPTTMTDVVGNRITPMNRDHNSSNTSGLTICHTPGGSQAGTANLTQYIGASASGGRVAEGGGSSSRHEFILDQNSSYYILVTSRADNNAMSIIMDWYEHTNR